MIYGNIVRQYENNVNPKINIDESNFILESLYREQQVYGTLLENCIDDNEREILEAKYEVIQEAVGAAIIAAIIAVIGAIIGLLVIAIKLLGKGSNTIVQNLKEDNKEEKSSSDNKEEKSSSDNKEEKSSSDNKEEKSSSDNKEEKSSSDNKENVDTKYASRIYIPKELYPKIKEEVFGNTNSEFNNFFLFIPSSFFDFTVKNLFEMSNDMKESINLDEMNKEIADIAIDESNIRMSRFYACVNVFNSIIDDVENSLNDFGDGSLSLTGEIYEKKTDDDSTIRYWSKCPKVISIEEFKKELILINKSNQNLKLGTGVGFQIVSFENMMHLKDNILITETMDEINKKLIPKYNTNIDKLEKIKTNFKKISESFNECIKQCKNPGLNVDNKKVTDESFEKTKESYVNYMQGFFNDTKNYLMSYKNYFQAMIWAVNQSFRLLNSFIKVTSKYLI